MTQKTETLTIEETAEKLGISVALTYKAARAGEIPVLRIGRRFLVLKAGLQKLLTPTK
jgi:excisionase family DNA binding protein